MTMPWYVRGALGGGDEASTFAQLAQQMGQNTRPAVTPTPAVPAPTVRQVGPMPGLPTAPAFAPDWLSRLPGMNGPMAPLYRQAMMPAIPQANLNLGMGAYSGQLPDYRALLQGLLTQRAGR